MSSTGMAATRSEEAEGIEDLLKCMICNKEIRKGDCIRKEYRCSHFFHEECLDKRAKRSFLCPICRAFILKPPELPDVVANITNKRLLQMRQEWATQAIKNDRRRLREVSGDNKSNAEADAGSEPDWEARTNSESNAGSASDLEETNGTQFIEGTAKGDACTKFDVDGNETCTSPHRLSLQKIRMLD